MAEESSRVLARSDTVPYPNKVRPHLPGIGLALLILLFFCEILFVRWDLPASSQGWVGHLIGLLCMTVAPGIALGTYIYYRDRYYDASLKLLTRIFLYAVLLSTLAGITNSLGAHLLGFRFGSATIMHNFFFFFFVVALGEEFVKFIVVWKLTYRSRMFKQVYDGILFCAVSALGFATIENILYVLTAGSHASEVAILRAVTAVPSHIADGVIMGYGMGRARAEKGSYKEAEWLILSFAGAVTLHGAYDFFLTFPSPIDLLFLIVMLIGWVIAFRLLKKGLADTPFTHCARCNRIIPQLASYCPHCRAKRQIELACPACGTKTTKWSRRCLKCYARIRFPWHLRANRLKDLYPPDTIQPCPACNEDISTANTFCPHCGQRINWQPV